MKITVFYTKMKKRPLFDEVTVFYMTHVTTARRGKSGTGPVGYQASGVPGQ